MISIILMSQDKRNSLAAGPVGGGHGLNMAIYIFNLCVKSDEIAQI